MNAMIRSVRAFPLIILLAVLAAIIYFTIASRTSKDHAKVLLINIFGWLNIILTLIFYIGVAYAWIEHNDFVVDLSAGFAVVSMIALGIVLIARWRFLKNRPNYQNEHPRKRGLLL